MGAATASQGSSVGLAAMLRLGSVPGSPEEIRSFLQRRLAQNLGIAALLWGLGFALAAVLGGIARPDTFHGVQLLRMVLHGGTVVALAALWLLARRGTRAPSWISTVDICATLMQGGLLAAMMLSSVPIVKLRPELSFILGLTYVLLTRAVVVPSTTRRTVLVGLAASTPMGVATYLAYSAALEAGSAPDLFTATARPWTFAAFASGFCGLSVFATAMVSSVIYGLQRMVQHARQIGQYRLEHKIGEGGMGVVYRGRHAMLRRPTAVKLLPVERAGEDTVVRFEREVQVTSQLTHPNTVAIYDYGRTPDNVFYYAMEYLDGLDLEVLVARDGPQPPGRVRHLLRQIAGSLGEAHARGLIHRDVKPSNIVVCERGLIPDFVKVLDFGLARDFDGREAKLTQAGQIAGTPLYMSPEQIRGETLDGRSDLYALGAVGYRLLTGQPIFAETSAVEVCADHLHTPVVPPSQRLGRPLPASLEALLLACLEKPRERRPLDAAALLAALDACADVPPWSDDDARRWWRDRGASLRAASAAGEKVSAHARTDAVKLGGGLPPAE